MMGRRRMNLNLYSEKSGSLRTQSPQMRGLLFLAVAFAALLTVIALSSYAVWRSSTVAQAHVEEQHQANMRSRTALSTIRSNVFLIGILTRDYLLDPSAVNAEVYREQFQTVREQTIEAFSVLGESAQTDQERSALRLLRSEIETNWDPGRITTWKLEGPEYLSVLMKERLRQRQEIVALAESIERIVAQNFESERARVAKADLEFQHSLGWIIGMAMFFTFAIAALTFLRMFSLGRQSQAAEIQLRLLSGQIRTTQEEERKRLSRELHDQVGQLLTGLRMELALISRLSDSRNGEFSSRLGRAKATAEQALEIVRNIAMLLRPSMLDDLGLTPALTWLTNEMSQSSGIAIRLEIDKGMDDLPESHRTCMYRVIQEGLTNVVRHSSASSAEVAVQAAEGRISASIDDNGRGFDSGTTRGLGLLGMEERARELGGALRVVSARGTGTRIEITLPNPNGGHEL